MVDSSGFGSAGRPVDMWENDKYRMLEQDCIIVDGRKLYRIQAKENLALPDGTFVMAGETGGYIEKMDNLSADGMCWVDNNAKVFGDAKVTDNALVANDATVSGRAEVSGESCVTGSAEVTDDAKVRHYANVGGNARVMDSGIVNGWAKVLDDAVVKDHGQVWDRTLLTGRSEVRGNGNVSGYTQMEDNAVVEGEANVFGDAILTDSAKVGGKVDFGTREQSAVVYLSGTQHLATKGGDGPRPFERVSVDSMSDLLAEHGDLVDGEENLGVTLKVKLLSLVGQIEKKIRKRYEGIFDERKAGSDSGWSKEDAEAPAFDEEFSTPAEKRQAFTSEWKDFASSPVKSPAPVRHRHPIPENTVPEQQAEGGELQLH